MTRYTATTDDDLRQMLAAIGVSSLSELFERQIPETVRLDRPLALPGAMSEQDVFAHLRALALRNVSSEDELSFLGAGMYDHYVPALIDMLMERSEFLTPYTPYQPEISQGGLQVMFEYQTAISELTALPVSNASVYDGPSAAAAAAYMAKLHNGRRRLVLSAGMHPHTRQTIATYARGYGMEVVQVPTVDGVTDVGAWAQAIDSDTSAALFAQPNFYGAVEDAQALSDAAHDGQGAPGTSDSPVVVAQVDPITLGVLRAPGECGVDVAVGEGQPLGNRLDFGGPSFGLFAAREQFLRRMPGRIAGETVDVDGRRGFVLTLQTREQHIRREKATSNICTAQALNALGAVVYLAWLGPRGLAELGELLLARTHYAREALGALDGVAVMHNQPVVREFALRLDADVAAVRGALRALGCEPGRRHAGAQRARAGPRRAARGDHRAAHARRHRSPRGRARGGGRGRARRRRARRAHAGARVVSVETPQQRDGARTIFQKGAPGRRAFVCPQSDVPDVDRETLLPARLRRERAPRLPEVSEPEIVRHYVGISKRNFDLDSGFYPLGSCTMKHNPRVNERVAALPGHARLHPLQDPARAQGALQLMFNLQEALAEISGLPYVSLQPSAGSHGELAGVMLARAYHEDRGQTRHKVLTPDTAHGTNPATVTMAGMQVVKLATDAAGGVDVEDLRAKADEDVACLMLTNPNTLGLFDPNIEQIASIVHGVGATLYYDGANLNAVMGISRPGDMGFDVVHFNLHKSFTQPHGGGGPGSGPIAVSERIAPFLPTPLVVLREASANGAGAGGERFYDLDHGSDGGPGGKSIGRLRGFNGNYGCLVRAYAYIRSLGAEGLKDASQMAVLNANYLLARLTELGVVEQLPLAYGQLCMHEFVLSGGPMKRDLQIQTLDLAKRLLDFGFHPPTVYFPLLVEEALMIEPTETETKETLDAFAQALADILSEAVEEGPRGRARRPLHDAGQAPGRGRRGQEPGHPAELSECASSRASSRRAASIWATTSARSASTSPGRTAAKGCTASSTCTRPPFPTIPPSCARACMTCWRCCSRRAWTRSAACSFARATWPSTPSCAGCCAA